LTRIDNSPHVACVKSSALCHDLAGHVQRVGQGADLLRECRCPLAIDVGDQDVRALAGEKAGDCRAQPRAAPVISALRPASFMQATPRP
jgi:hypothetical protein